MAYTNGHSKKCIDQIRLVFKGANIIRIVRANFVKSCHVSNLSEVFCECIKLPSLCQQSSLY